MGNLYLVALIRRILCGNFDIDLINIIFITKALNFEETVVLLRLILQDDRKDLLR